jgi:hypothetical protein
MTDRMEKIIAAGEADHEAVRLRERAKIVAWLREAADTIAGNRDYIHNCEAAGTIDAVADAIESGDHLGDPT